MKAKCLLVRVILGFSLVASIMLLGAFPAYAAPPRQGGVVGHRVRAGENLAGIAARYGTTVDAIVRKNGIANPNLIYAGQYLVISGAASSSVVPAARASSGGCAYRIAPGDTLLKIASQHGTTVQHLMSANGLSSTLIWAGSTLRVPCGHAQVASSAAKPSPAQRSTKGAASASYRVKYGDTLSGIALLYRTTVPAIMAANGLGNPHHIYAGQTLQIRLR